MSARGVVSSTQPAARGRYIGKPLRRREDARFVQGQGCYVDDIALPNTAWCAFVRSPHAHARIKSIATDAAAAMPGVLLTLTAADWERAGHGELTIVHPMPFSDGRPMNGAPRPAFASGKVRHVGDIVAAVVGESRFAAEAGAEAVVVEYDPLPSVSTPRDALAPDAPILHEQFGSNIVFDVERGSRETTEAALASAAKVVELDLNNSRLSANPMEPRCYLCDYDAGTDRYTLYATTPTAALSSALAIGLHAAYPRAQDESDLPRRRRWIRREGAFFHRGLHHRLGRPDPSAPVKWTATRSETLLSDSQARDHETTARMGFDRRWPHRRHADRYARGAGRLSQQFRTQHSRQLLSADGNGSLSHAEPAFARTRRLHQHGAG